MSEPKSTNVPPELSALGNVQAEYVENSMIVIGLVLAGACLAAGIVQLGLYFGAGIVYPVGAVLTLAGLVIGLVGIVMGIVGGRSRALVFADAIALVRRGKATVMRWDDVTAVYQEVIVERKRGGGTSKPEYTYTLRSKDAMMVFHDYKNIEALGNTIQTEVTKRLAPRYLASFNKGNPVKFGKVVLSKPGLDIGGGVIPWGEVEQVSLNMGNINVRRNGQWAAVVGQDAARTPNLNVMMGLINQNTQAQNK